MAEKKQRLETMAVEGLWNIGAYHYKAPHLMDEYVQGLKERKLIGTLCRGCGKVIVPPRNICGRCHRKMDGRRVVSNVGTITCFVCSAPMAKGKVKIFGLDPVDMGLVKEGEVVIPVFVKFDGSDSNVHTILIGGDPDKVFIGMRVRAVFAKEPKGALADLEGVEPLK
jgi:hypothetical protein